MAPAFAMTVATGCAATPPPQAQTAPVATQAPDAEPRPAAASPAPTTVAISDEIRTRCGISERDAYFTFDSAQVTARDRSPLDGVAHCFSTGPLKGRRLKLIGHADPRGEADYNMTLGQSRADAVGQYLVTRGLQPANAKTTSRGSMDAAGTDDASWQKDRRVDVTLGD